MNQALQQWREAFTRDPEPAFDRLLRGLVPLGAAAQLSFGEILDDLFEPGDAALDAAAAGWLEKQILAPVPDSASLHRWTAVLQEFFRGVAMMELPKTGKILRDEHRRLRLWLRGLHEGPDRDPEGAYLIALARAQDDQRFSPLWRRLILGEELAGHAYLAVGMLGFRKMPGLDGREASDVPRGLLQALVELADKPGVSKEKWKQTMRSLFATYRRSEHYWVEHLAPLLPDHNDPSGSRSRDWLTALLPGVSRWRPPAKIAQFPLGGMAQAILREVTMGWIGRVRHDLNLCDNAEISTILDPRRTYAKSKGDSESLGQTFNTLATTLFRRDRKRTGFAVDSFEGALLWGSLVPPIWTFNSKVLGAEGYEDDAMETPWKVWLEFAWDLVMIRIELGQILREQRDMASDDAISRSGLAETLRSLGGSDDALQVYAQASRDFLNNVFCGSGLADLLIELSNFQEAEIFFRAALQINSRDAVARSGLARALSIRSTRTRDEALRDEAEGMLRELAAEGDQDARRQLANFDDPRPQPTTDPTITVRQVKF